MCTRASVVADGLVGTATAAAFLLALAGLAIAEDCRHGFVKVRLAVIDTATAGIIAVGRAPQDSNYRIGSSARAVARCSATHGIELGSRCGNGMSLVEIFHVEGRLLLLVAEGTMVVIVVVTILVLPSLAEAGHTDVGLHDALDAQQAFGIEGAVARQGQVGMEAGQAGVGRILVAGAAERNVRDGGGDAIGGAAPASTDIPLVAAADVVDRDQRGPVAAAQVGGRCGDALVDSLGVGGIEFLRMLAGRRWHLGTTILPLCRPGLFFCITRLDIVISFASATTNIVCR